ncbi:hypothetical protein [Sulfurimonas sp.]|uniref:hypothetical protein n=1 Tax=Sulfurimonas sp. TaxID=2022749 RepID=UPI002AB267C6|nr:hypothetical protein [Sulfurimonas sp.]
MNNKLSIMTFFTIIIIAILSSGCSTVQVAKDSKGTGTKKIYTKSKLEVWSAMKIAVVNTGGEIVEEDTNKCSVLAKYGVSAFSWGERVGGVLLSNF